MSPENLKRIREAVNEAGLHLEGKLPPCEGLSKRNPYAHLWERIKHEMGRPCKECEDYQVDIILQIVRIYRVNPCLVKVVIANRVSVE